MTTAVSGQPARSVERPRRFTRRAAILLATLVALPAIGLTYVAGFGQCDWHSRFCAINVVGTRSEVVVVWLDGVEVYSQTYNSE